MSVLAFGVACPPGPGMFPNPAETCIVFDPVFCHTQKATETDVNSKLGQFIESMGISGK